KNDFLPVVSLRALCGAAATPARPAVKVRRSIIVHSPADCSLERATLLSRARHRFHSTLGDCFRGLVRGEESNQPPGIVRLSRAGHDGGCEHLRKLNLRREASRIIYTLRRQDLTDRHDRDADATIGDHGRCAGSAWHDLDVEFLRNTKAG